MRGLLCDGRAVRGVSWRGFSTAACRPPRGLRAAAGIAGVGGGSGLQGAVGGAQLHRQLSEAGRVVHAVSLGQGLEPALQAFGEECLDLGDEGFEFFLHDASPGVGAHPSSFSTAKSLAASLSDISSRRFPLAGLLGAVGPVPPRWRPANAAPGGPRRRARGV
ncbi:hypothetical protein P4133_33170 [Pseudomonas aeruginosa]|nr:hypothetical protein [Pseudomonas aeruginosa]